MKDFEAIKNTFKNFVRLINLDDNFDAVKKRLEILEIFEKYVYLDSLVKFLYAGGVFEYADYKKLKKLIKEIK